MAKKSSKSQLDTQQLELKLERSMDHVFEMFLGLQKICNGQLKQVDANPRRPSKYTYLVQ